MIDLDTRARQASAALRRSVGEAELTLSEPPTVRVRVTWRSNPGWAMAAGALTALVVLFGVLTLRPAIVADDLATTTSTSTVPPTTAATAPPTTVTTMAPPTAGPAAVPAAPPPTTTVPDTTPPSIAITRPSDGQVFDESRITFAGTTEPGAQVFGGPYEATVDREGNWSIVLILSEGPNRATFTAVDAAGNRSSAQVTAVYDPPAPVEPKEPEVAAFHANATWLECSESPPFDEYYGTGQPGSWVAVVSEWGSGETLVGPDGTWYVKVFFLEAPYGKEFQVKVKDQYGRYEYFPMVRTG